MTESSVTVFCHWGGDIIEDSNNLRYEGGQRKGIRVNGDMTYSELLERMYKLTKHDKDSNKLTMICRYPDIIRPSGEEYIRMDVADDEALKIMLDVVKLHTQLSSVHLYLVLEPICNALALPESQGRGIVEPSSQNCVSHSTTLGSLDFNFLITNENHGNGEDEHMVNTARNKFLTHGMEVNNDLIEDADYDNEVEHSSDEDNDKVNDTDKQLFEVPSSYFTNVNSTDVACVSQPFLISHAGAWDPSEELKKGLIFDTKDEFYHLVKTYNIQRRREFIVSESKPTNCVLKCKLHSQAKCKWMVRATKRKSHGKFQIGGLRVPHTCVNTGMKRESRQLDSRFLSREVSDMVKAQPMITIAALKAHVNEKYNYNVSYKKVWLAKQKAIKHIFGDWDTSYQMLPKFMAALQHYNPGTIVEWRTIPIANCDNVVFDSVFWAFQPSIDGFKHCRPVISIDSSHLYGKYGGKMLIAMGIDANNMLFPLAFAIVDEENIRSWSWFLTLLRQHVVFDRWGLCLISDQNTDIIAAVKKEGSTWHEPYAYHVFCLRHIVSNFHTKFPKKDLKDLVYAAGNEHQVSEFNKIMYGIGQRDADALKWLEAIPVHQWTQSHDHGRRYGAMTTNLTEVFNGIFKGARGLSITACVQLIFYRLVSYFNDRRMFGTQAVEFGLKYTPYVTTMLDSYMSVTDSLEVVGFDHGIFEVIIPSIGSHGQEDNQKQVVRVNERSCTCGKWQIYKIPCSHVLAVCSKMAIDSWQYIDDCYTIKEYVATWASQFQPLHHEKNWPTSTVPTLLPNNIRRRSKKGRPRSTRLRNEPDIREELKNVHCGICGTAGHDRRRCPNKL